MKNYNIGFSGDSTSMFKALLEHVDSLKILEGAKVAVVSTTTAKETLLGIDGVSFVEEDTPITLTAHSWHLQRISTQFLPLPAIPHVTNGGEDSTVYLVDGIIYPVQELQDANIRVLYSDENAATDMHGTRMASLIVGKTIGVSPKANLVSVQIPMNTSITVSRLLSAFDAILTDPLRPAVSVVNCSWSIPKSQLLDTKIAELQNAGIVVVAAAGNSGIAADTLSPAGLDTVIGVGACDVFDRVISWDTGSSNWGPEVDVFAPGIDIQIPEEDGTVYSVSGTSLSCAIVSGIVAQHITKNPTFSAPSIQQSVIDNSVVDVLFWDEDVYGTTPNRLVQSSRLLQQDMWEYTRPTVGYHAIKSGETLTIDIPYMLPVVEANYHTTHETFRNIVPFSWVSTTDLGGVVRLTLSPVVPVADKFIVAIRGVDAAGNLVSSVWLRVGVYIEDESELSPLAEEKYLLYISENDSVELTPHTFCCGGGCPKGSFCCTFTGQLTDYTCVDDNTWAVACC